MSVFSDHERGWQKRCHDKFRIIDIPMYRCIYIYKVHIYIYIYIYIYIWLAKAWFSAYLLGKSLHSSGEKVGKKKARPIVVVLWFLPFSHVFASKWPQDVPLDWNLFTYEGFSSLFLFSFFPQDLWFLLLKTETTLRVTPVIPQFRRYPGFQKEAVRETPGFSPKIQTIL